jgi:hypothetical protein
MIERWVVLPVSDARFFWKFPGHCVNQEFGRLMVVAKMQRLQKKPDKSGFFSQALAQSCKKALTG